MGMEDGDGGRRGGGTGEGVRVWEGGGEEGRRGSGGGEEGWVWVDGGGCR